MLNAGDIIELGKEHTVYADVPKHFVYDNRRGCFALTHACVSLADDNFDYLTGKYVVYRTVHDGGGAGGYGRPNNSADDIYFDGHHVFCEKVNDPGVKVDFYQTGSFTALIEEIEPVGQATRRWVSE